MFSGLESPLHLVVLGVIALLVFGPKKLPELGGSLGRGIREFRQTISGEEAPKPITPDERPVPARGARDDDDNVGPGGP